MFNLRIKGCEAEIFEKLFIINPKQIFKMKSWILWEMGFMKNLELLDYHFANPKEITEPLHSEYTLHSHNFSDHILDIHFMELPFMVGVEKHTAISSKERHNTLDLQDITHTAPTLQKLTVHFADGLGFTQFA